MLLGRNILNDAHNTILLHNNEVRLLQAHTQHKIVTKNNIMLAFKLELSILCIWMSMIGQLLTSWPIVLNNDSHKRTNK